MTGELFPQPEMSVDEIMRRWPATIGVMIRNRFLCIGCPIGPLHTVAEACLAHGVDEALFRAELAQAIGTGERPISAEGSRQRASGDADP